uniref:acireductone dioxygenase (Fe(2+)-requiring) n=1 Tax=Lygus hesperus TaxID=30085 RepID=A0A0A9WLD7_LYGHE
MVKAWYMDDSSEDQRLEHHRSPPEFVDLAVLEKSTGVEYIKIEDIENLANNEQLSVLMKKRGYTYEDQITCSKGWSSLSSVTTSLVCGRALAQNLIPDHTYAILITPEETRMLEAALLPPPRTSPD